MKTATLILVLTCTSFAANPRTIFKSIIVVDTLIDSALTSGSIVVNSAHKIVNGVVDSANNAKRAVFADSSKNTHKADTSIGAKRSVFSDSSTNSHKSDTSVVSRSSTLWGAHSVPAGQVNNYVLTTDGNNWSWTSKSLLDTTLPAIQSINGSSASAQTIKGEKGLEVLDSGATLQTHVIQPATGYIIPTGANNRVDSSNHADTADKSNRSAFSDSSTNSHKSDTSLAAKRSAFADSSTNSYKADTALDAGKFGGKSTAYYDTIGHGAKFNVDQTSPQTVIGTPRFPDLLFPSWSQGSPTYSTLNDYLKLTQSSGKLDSNSFVITANGNGTVSISGGKCVIKSTNTVNAETKFYDFIGQANISLVDSTVNYLVFNCPTLTVFASTSRDTIHQYDQFIVGRVYREGNDASEVSNTGMNVYNFNRRQHNKELEIYGLRYVSGAVVSEYGTRQLLSTSGVWYIGETRFTTPGKRSDTAGVDIYWRASPSGWKRTAGFTGSIPDTGYDNGSGTIVGLQNTNRYGIYFLYVCVQGDMYLVYGQGDYLTLADARAAVAPATLPHYVSTNTRLRYKLIFKKGATNFAELDEFTSNNYQISNAVSHNDLSGLQGGTSAQYYHLTAAQQTEISNDSISRAAFAHNADSLGHKPASYYDTIGHGTIGYIHRTFEFSLNGQASGTVGLFSRAGASTNNPAGLYPVTYNSNNFENGQTDGYVALHNCVINDLTITFAQVAVNQGTVGASPVIRLTFYKNRVAARDSIGIANITISSTGVGVNNSLGTNSKQAVTLTNLGISLTAGDAWGFEFTPLQANNNQINALGRAYVVIDTRE